MLPHPADYRRHPDVKMRSDLVDRQFFRRQKATQFFDRNVSLPRVIAWSARNTSLTKVMVHGSLLNAVTSGDLRAARTSAILTGNRLSIQYLLGHA
jgi:hypothetical protein